MAVVTQVAIVATIDDSRAQPALDSCYDHDEVPPTVAGLCVGLVEEHSLDDILTSPILQASVAVAVNGVWVRGPCPYGDVCSGCDAAGTCSRLAQP